jgi:hypothetical protein
VSAQLQEEQQQEEEEEEDWPHRRGSPQPAREHLRLGETRLLPHLYSSRLARALFVLHANTKTTHEFDHRNEHEARLSNCRQNVSVVSAGGTSELLHMYIAAQTANADIHSAGNRLADVEQQRPTPLKGTVSDDGRTRSAHISPPPNLIHLPCNFQPPPPALLRAAAHLRICIQF